MNRFEKNSSFFYIIIKFMIPLTVLLLIFALYAISIQSIQTESEARQYESLQNALYRDVIQCYSIEGTYPPNLTYLQEHYGLTYNKDLFFVDYQTFGSNIMPDITIIKQ